MIVAVTQRLGARGPEVRDCLDRAWAGFFAASGVAFAPVPTGLADPVAWADSLGVGALVLSGGETPGPWDPDSADPARDRAEAALLGAAQDRALPVLGVCRGAQMIQTFLGGRLRRVDGHAGTEHALAPVADGPEAPWPFGPNVPALVRSYHDWGLGAADLAPGLRPLLAAPDATVEAFVHKSLPWCGLMWHPERDGAPREHDLAVVRWLLARAGEGAS